MDLVPKGNCGAAPSVNAPHGPRELAQGATITLAIVTGCSAPSAEISHPATTVSRPQTSHARKYQHRQVMSGHVGPK